MVYRTASTLYTVNIIILQVNSDHNNYYRNSNKTLMGIDHKVVMTRVVMIEGGR